MKRKLIVAIVVIIAACVAVHFYVQWEKARFDASLPEVPAEDTAGGHWHGDEWHAEPHVADEAPPVQPVTRPAETDEMEAARQRVEALKLQLSQPDELGLERKAIKADFNALLEQRGTLSLAEFEKRLDDIARRRNAWHKKWTERAKERAAAYRKMDAERQESVASDR